ncbi:MAG: 1-deoxy-D-xylulose-5-phosphate synthase [Eubacteriales bacterium]|nr:1-deoxy-D-xylulose-5-phosphate synthase [Eubacteriales bacterium]
MLEEIRCPADVRHLDTKQMRVLAREIRKFLVRTVSKTGGHLASNLGVVELTLALCKCFRFPEDDIVWDVGHQSYVYKLLTGRRSGFDRLREIDAMSGFPCRTESPYDAFGTGHASTGIAAANGIATAKKLSGDESMTMAVIGDGALTGGLALEGINNLSGSKNRLVIILNDNEMSIDENVGATSFALSRLRVARPYLRLKENISDRLEHVPRVGDEIMRGLRRAKNSVKQLLVPGMNMENLGLRYYGPIDGHDLKQLTAVFQRIRHINRPVMIHVKTVKGMGYRPAFEAPAKFHGIGPFHPETGKTDGKPADEATFTDAFADAVTDLAIRHEEVVGITAAMLSSTGLDRMQASVPDRVFDVGIAEEYAVTFAAGMATRGLRPVVAVYSTFLQRAYDQILHDVCLQNLPVIFAVDRAGIVGKDGATHQGLFDLSFLNAMPNMTVLCPVDGADLRAALNYAYTWGGPVAIRYPRGTVPSNLPPAPYRRGVSVMRATGRDGTLCAVGAAVHTALAVREELLAQGGPEIGVMDARFVKPLDTAMLDELRGPVFVLEEGILRGGYGESIRAYMAARRPEVPVETFGVEDQFVHHGTPEDLRARLGLDMVGIIRRIRQSPNIGAAGNARATTDASCEDTGERKVK